MRDVGIRKLEEDSEDVQRSVLGGVLKYAISGEARTLSRTTRDWLPAGPRYSGTCLKRHFWNLREETLILFYKQRARAERTTTRWSLPDDGRWSLIKETMFLCCVYAFASFPTGYEPRYAMLCKTALKYLGFSEMAQWCCSPEIPTIEPSEVFTSRSKRVRITNPTFQGLDVFFREMLVEHWS